MTKFRAVQKISDQFRLYVWEEEADRVLQILDIAEAESVEILAEYAERHDLVGLPVGTLPMGMKGQIDTPERECPVSAAQVLASMAHGDFDAFAEHDYDAFAGTEGDGFTAEINDCMVVLDSGPTGIIVNVTESGEGNDGAIWSYELTGSEPTHIGSI